MQKQWRVGIDWISRAGFALSGFLLLQSFAGPLWAQSGTQPEAATAPEPTTYSLHLQDVSREEAIQQFGHATNLLDAAPPVNLWNADSSTKPRISLDIKDETFWQALAHLQEAADIGFDATDASMKLNPTRARGNWGWTGRPEVECGPLLLSVRQVGRRSTIFYAEPATARDTLSMSLSACVPAGGIGGLQDDGLEATSLLSDQGVELLPRKVVIQNFNTLNPWRVDLQLLVPLSSARQIKSVSIAGVCHCLWPIGRRTVEVADPEKTPTDVTVAGHVVHVVTQQEGRRLVVRLTAKGLPHEDRAALQRFGRQLWSLMGGQLRLTQANGTPLPSHAANLSVIPALGGSNQVEMNKRFDPADASSPYTLHWTVCDTVRESNEPFKIEEICVP